MLDHELSVGLDHLKDVLDGLLAAVHAAGPSREEAVGHRALDELPPLLLEVLHVLGPGLFGRRYRPFHLGVEASTILQVSLPTNFEVWARYIAFISL